jgi:hypothetical protein
LAATLTPLPGKIRRSGEQCQKVLPCTGRISVLAFSSNAALKDRRSMPIFSTITVEEARELSTFKFSHPSRLHLLLPAAFLALALMLLFGLEYYKDWKRKRRMNRYWQEKSGRSRG